MPVPATTISKVSTGYYNSSQSIGESDADLSAFRLAVAGAASIGGQLSTSSLSLTGSATVSSLLSTAQLSVGTSNAATIIRISSVTFQTGILGHLATNSSDTTFAFSGCSGSNVLVSVSPTSSLSTAFFVACSSGSNGVGALKLQNTASIATLAPMVWRAVAIVF